MEFLPDNTNTSSSGRPCWPHRDEKMCVILWSKCPGCCVDMEDPDLQPVRMLYCRNKRRAQREDRLREEPTWDWMLYYPCENNSSCKSIPRPATPDGC